MSDKCEFNDVYESAFQYDKLYEYDFSPGLFARTCETRFRSVIFQFYGSCLSSNPEILFMGLFYYNNKQDFWTSGDSEVQRL